MKMKFVALARIKPIQIFYFENYLQAILVPL